MAGQLPTLAETRADRLPAKAHLHVVVDVGQSGKAGAKSLVRSFKFLNLLHRQNEAVRSHGVDKLTALEAVSLFRYNFGSLTFWYRFVCTSEPIISRGVWSTVLVPKEYLSAERRFQ